MVSSWPASWDPNTTTTTTPRVQVRGGWTSRFCFWSITMGSKTPSQSTSNFFAMGGRNHGGSQAWAPTWTTRHANQKTGTGKTPLLVAIKRESKQHLRSCFVGRSFRQGQWNRRTGESVCVCHTNIVYIKKMIRADE